MAANLRAPGWYRAALWLAIGVAFSFALTIVVRGLYGWDPLIKDETVLQIALLALPLTFLGGMGCFDYWLY
jgi:cytochrome c oxidase subunit I